MAKAKRYLQFLCSLEKMWDNKPLLDEWPDWAENAVNTGWFSIPRTAVDMVKLGITMDFSVGQPQYIQDVADGKYIIITYKPPGSHIKTHATLQIDPENPFHIMQNRGFRNHTNVDRSIQVWVNVLKEMGLHASTLIYDDYHSFIKTDNGYVGYIDIGRIAVLSKLIDLPIIDKTHAINLVNEI